MKTVLFTLLMCLLEGLIPLNSKMVSNTSSDQSTLLTFENTDHNLLNRAVFEEINKERIRRKVDTLAFNSSLNQFARKNQSALEFRTFKNGVKIQSKINKNIQKSVKELGFKGGLATSVAAECNAINYTKDKPFFHIKNDQKNKLGLYYGAKKDLKNSEITVEKIPNYTYHQFAKALLKSLSSKQKKILYSKSYSQLAIQLNWYYKSLHKRKIPQIKLVAILGGYITAGLRN